MVGISLFFASLFLCWTFPRSDPRCLSHSMAPSGERLQCGAASSKCSVCCRYVSLSALRRQTVRLDELAGRVNDLSVMISLVPHLPHHVLPRPMSHLPRPMFVPVPLPTSMSTRLDIRLSSALVDLMCPSI